MSNYRRVPSTAGASSGEDQQQTDAATSPASTKPLAERLSDKLYALVWVVVALVMARLAHVPKVLLSSDSGANRTVLHVAFLLLGVNTVLTGYLGVYLPKIKGIKGASAWDAYCPRIVPIMTVTGIACGICFIRATFPVWGFLSPLILGIEAMGAFFSLHFIPWC